MGYRAAVIGCGNIGSMIDEEGHQLGIQTHASAYMESGNTVLAALCDSDPDRLNQAGQRRKVDLLYTDHQELLGSCAPEIVSVAVSTDKQGVVLKDVLRTPSVKLVICEKPFGSSVEEAHHLIDLASQTGCRIYVNYSRHYLPAMLKAGEFIRDRLGELQIARGLYTKSLRHNGSHMLDLLTWWLGTLHVEHCMPAQRATKSCVSPDVVLGTAEDSPRIYMQALDASAFSLFELDIIGSEGRVIIAESGDEIALYEVDEDPRYDGFNKLHASGSTLKGCLTDLMLHVVTGALGCFEGQPNAEKRCCTAEQALMVTKLVQDAYSAFELEGVSLCE